MKKTICLFLSFLFLSSTNVVCQKIIKKTEPLSFKYQSSSYPLTDDVNIRNIIMSSINRDSLLDIDKENYKLQQDIPFRFGYKFNVKFNIDSIGTWDELENGDRLWRLKIICPEAYSINMIYNKFEIPNGAQFFLYDSTKKFILGAFTEINNKKHGKFATDLTPGEICWLEYYEPKEVHGKGIIEISNVIQGYVDIRQYFNEMLFKKNNGQDKLQSGECNRNVNCPEGNDWCREKYSVSYIILGNYLCSGSLINNTSNDFTPYLLTANHCYVATPDPDIWIFQFGYMYEYCNGGWTFPNFSYSGADLRASWATSDFALLELQEQPESGENNFPDVFFNGWDMSGDVPNNTTCLHHPSGDLLKISIDDDSPVSSSYADHTPNDNTHWKVIWNDNSNENNGVTEGGSSGSPLFYHNHRLIGQLHGGGSSCTYKTLPDWYGKFSVSWFGGGTDATSLHNWLDPIGHIQGDITSIDGVHLPNNQYGVIHVGGTFNYNAYDLLRVGSDNYIPTPFQVNSGVIVNLKAGREIHIRPCTRILCGSTFHAYIEELDCDDVVIHSDRDDEYGTDCGSSGPRITSEFNLNEDIYSLEKSVFSIVPNPSTGLCKMKYKPVRSCNVNIVMTDILGNNVKTILHEYKNAGSYDLEADLSSLPAGMYFVVFSNCTERIVQKLVKM